MNTYHRKANRFELIKIFATYFPTLDMKILYMFSISLITIGFTKAQSTITYDFQDTLAAQNNAGPKLKKLGSGGFKTDTINCANQVRRVYHFDKNMGLQFDNDLANNWFQKSYTIELYFKMEEMNSWKRVVDYKNRISDWGCYVFFGKLNFYNIATSDTIPFSAGKYQYYTVTRDSTTKLVSIYSSGSSRIRFVDTGDQAIVGQANVLNFFQDDLAVQNEASAGDIALLRLTNIALDSTAVKNRYENLCATLTSNKLELETLETNIFPNPAKTNFTVWAPENHAIVRVQLIDSQGKEIRNWNGFSNLDLSGVNSGLYFVKVVFSNYSQVHKLLLE